MFEELEEMLSGPEIDWCQVDSAVKTLGENVNAWEEGESLLAFFYGVVEEAEAAYKLTEIFLRNGFDIGANDGRNGLSCLETLCDVHYKDEALPIVELLLENGALRIDALEPESEVFKAIQWGLDSWGEGLYAKANLFEAYNKMVLRSLNGLTYKGIRGCAECVGKVVTKVEKVTYAGDADFVDATRFAGALVFWCEGVPLVFESKINAMLNPYYAEEASKIENVSSAYASIIGSKIKDISFLSPDFAKVRLDNGKFMLLGRLVQKKGSNFVSIGMVRVDTAAKMCPLKKDEVIETVGIIREMPYLNWIHGYSLPEVFFKTKDKLFHISAEEESGVLHVYELPFEWSECIHFTAGLSEMEVEHIRASRGNVEDIELSGKEGTLLVLGDDGCGKVNVFCFDEQEEEVDGASVIGKHIEWQRVK